MKIFFKTLGCQLFLEGFFKKNSMIPFIVWSRSSKVFFGESKPFGKKIIDNFANINGDNVTSELTVVGVDWYFNFWIFAFPGGRIGDFQYSKRELDFQIPYHYGYAVQIRQPFWKNDSTLGELFRRSP